MQPRRPNAKICNSLCRVCTHVLYVLPYLCRRRLGDARWDRRFFDGTAPAQAVYIYARSLCLAIPRRPLLPFQRFKRRSIGERTSQSLVAWKHGSGPQGKTDPFRGRRTKWLSPISRAPLLMLRSKHHAEDARGGRTSSDQPSRAVRGVLCRRSPGGVSQP